MSTDVSEELLRGVYAQHGLEVPHTPEEPPDGPDAAQPQAAPDLGGLVIRSLAEVAADVDSRPPRPFLFEPVWVAGDYGVLAAEDKAGKTWAILDAAVSCASGLDWQGQFPCRAPGGVLVFLGEGSDAKMLRRIRAIGMHKGLTREQVDALPIRLCFRAPQLNDKAHLSLIAADLDEYSPALCIIDPLYLAAGGANGADLYAMGAMLGSIQAVAQANSASLLLAHHWNKTGEGKGHHRSSGVGPGAWGRVLIAVSVLNARTDPQTTETTVRLKWSFKGDEIPETDVNLVRRVVAQDPTDLTSPLKYSIEKSDDQGEDDDTPDDGMSPSQRRIKKVLASASGPLTVLAIGDQLAADTAAGPPLKKRTIQDALTKLMRAGHAREAGTDGFAALWVNTEPEGGGNAE
ncbi:AAA family ATPase [Nocardiopsis suaedae]|uniref:AAA family ATPase n=1 Tax=Nocardiopsis suaedae TaxID=3018444 RepID=A0ABT4TM01_9ACTN|nr:AAA family ATPase [Nocardiopsis suaedae]MDA2805728.1 AAA family ATPase [Nocardiopsis suaedae]